MKKLEAADERRLVMAAKAGDRAATERLISALRPLVQSIARGVTGAAASMDIEQDGFVGLLRALSKFDPDRGVRFTTYATPWIEGEIREAVRGDHLIVLPTEKALLASRASRSAEALTSELGREPTTDEVANAVGVEPTELEAISHVLGPVLLAAPDELDDLGDATGGGDVDPEDARYSEREVTRLVYSLSDQIGRMEGAIETERWGTPTKRASRSRAAVDGRLIDIEDALVRLPEDEFRAIEVHAFYALTFPEAGQWIGVHENTVRNRFRSGIGLMTAHLNGEHRLAERLREPSWRAELQPVECLRLVVRRFHQFFTEFVDGLEGEAGRWLATQEIGWVLLDGEGWSPLISNDVRRTAREMRASVRRLSDFDE